MARIVYGRGELLSLYDAAAVPAADVARRVRALGLWTTCRLRCIGRKRRFVRPSSSNNRNAFMCCYRGRRAGVVLPKRVDRHSKPKAANVVFGCINIRSLANKVDDLLEVCRDHHIDVLFLTETWHDADSVCLRHLAARGYQVAHRPRPRLRDDVMLTNHGGVAAIAAPGVRLSTLDLGVRPRTFELIGVRVGVGSSSCIAVTIYRPGSEAVTSAFLDEMSDMLDRLATFVEPVYIVGDANVHFEKPTLPPACRLIDDLAMHGLVNCVTTATHDRDGALDIVVSRVDLPLPLVTVLDVGLSDHGMLRWSAPFTRPQPVYTKVTSRPWSQLNVDRFRAEISASALCSPDCWTDLSVDSMAQLYDDVLFGIADRLAPSRLSTYRRRPSDPWFDADCRVAKGTVRLFERDARRANRSRDVDAAAAATMTARWYERRREYRRMLREKRESFWKSKVAAEGSSPRQLWHSIDVLMGRGSVQTSVGVGADKMHHFFDEKIANIRASTADAPPPSFAADVPSSRLDNLRLLTVADVAVAVHQLPDKQCMSDPIPTRLLKQHIDLLAPFLAELFNRSLTAGVVPTGFKSAYVTPLIKKADLDPADVKSYRPISNLSVVSKLLERLVARQLTDYLSAERLLPDLQSAYRAYHSTETALLKVLSDILLAVDGGDLAVLTLLDLSAAFDTVDHATLLRRLKATYGLGGSAINWFKSYLEGRTQYIRCRTSCSAPTRLLCGVPQGSVLGPILFLLYTAELLQLIQATDLRPHLYADDTQIYGFCRPGAATHLQDRMTACIDSVSCWMRSNRLQLNTAKTEVLWCASARRQHQLPSDPLIVGSDAVKPTSCVRDLGIYVDSALSMTSHVTRTVSGCFAALRQIRSIRRSVTRPVLLSLVASLVLSRLDYGLTTLAGLPAQQLNRLQSVLNAAARLVYSARKFDHITPLLKDLHWLRIPERIQYRLSLLVFRCLHGQAPRYLADELQRTSDVESRRRLRSASTASLVVPATKHSTIGDRAFPVAAARAWNCLPDDVTSLNSLPAFKRRLKTELFRHSFPDAGH